MVDAGPDTFLARVPWGKQLAGDLGLAAELVAPVSPVPAYLHRDGALRPLPTGTVLGVPTDLGALAESGTVSPAGVERASQEPHLPPTPLFPDNNDVEISVGAYCRARLGDEVTERLIDPLIGGINASHIDRLSLRDGAPQLWAAASTHDSIITGLAAMRPRVGATLGSAGTNEPVFLSLPEGGISRLISRLVEELDEADLYLGHAVTDLEDLDTDHIILATPAPVAARLLRNQAPAVAAEMQTIGYASVAQVTVELPLASVNPVLDASGILFPRVDGKMMTAATWFSTKWAHYARPDSVLVRLTSGRFNDDRPAQLSDVALTQRLLNDLRSVVEITAEPIATRVHRWNEAFPQYEPGHGAKVQRIVDGLAAEAPGLHLVGAAYRGIGIPACINDGRSLAARLIDGAGSPQ